MDRRRYPSDATDAGWAILLPPPGRRGKRGPALGGPSGGLDRGDGRASRRPSTAETAGRDGGKRGSRGYDAGRRAKGRERRIVLGSMGLAHALPATPASAKDRPGGRSGSSSREASKGSGLVPQKGRWGVERTFARRVRRRRLRGDYGALPTRAARAHATMVRLMARRLAKA